MEGFVSSALATLITHPCDVLKTQVQANGIRMQKLTFRDAYRGVGPQLGAQAVFYGLYFSIDRSHSLLEVGAASLVASTVANPLFILKVRAQTGGKSSLRQIWQHEDFSGFGKGLLGTYANNMKLFVQFPLYAYLTKETEVPVPLASTGAKLVANTVFYPTDTVRTLVRNSVKKLSTWQAIQLLNSQKGFYRGFVWYNAFSIPHFVLVMCFKEWLFNKT